MTGTPPERGSSSPPSAASAKGSTSTSSARTRTPVREAYGDSVYDRLVDVKGAYDPDNVFHHNQNIRPALSDGEGSWDRAGDG